MFSFTLLALAGAAFAAPARRTAGCDISGITFVPPTGYDFPSPAGAPKFVTVGSGTQNYTCGTDNKWAPAGAVASLFDLSCVIHEPEFDIIQDLFIEAIHGAGLTYDGLPLLSNHYFVINPVTGEGISPKFDFSPSVGDFVTGKLEVSTPAPTGPQDINWLKLSNIDGGLSHEVYRTDTREGQPPSSCDYHTETTTEIPYTAKYWFH